MADPFVERSGKVKATIMVILLITSLILFTLSVIGFFDEPTIPEEDPDESYNIIVRFISIIKLSMLKY